MNQGIYPERLAAAYVKHAGEKYRPIPTQRCTKTQTLELF